jgi:AraC-like DNA-binding protein
MYGYRIFDSVLESHSWTADGRLCVAQQPQSHSFQDPSPKAEIDALFSRLLLRSKPDRTLCRAAKRLCADPSISSSRLASELGVSERYLLSGLRAILGVDPQAFLRQAASLNSNMSP